MSDISDMGKFMRILVFFDLPVKTKAERKTYSRFRSFLIKDGYHMLQYSLYARTCNGADAVEKHKKRIYANLPDNGSVRLLVITEKQFESIEILVGDLTVCDDPFQAEQLSIF
jgi:CRISPR-associated protein Cas2